MASSSEEDLVAVASSGVTPIRFAGELLLAPKRGGILAGSGIPGRDSRPKPLEANDRARFLIQRLDARWSTRFVKSRQACVAPIFPLHRVPPGRAASAGEPDPLALMPRIQAPAAAGVHGAGRTTAARESVVFRFALLAGMLAPSVPAADGPVAVPGWIVDANVGVPKVELNRLAFDVGATLGHAWPRFGGVAYFRRSTFDEQTASAELLDIRTGAGARGWLNLGEPDGSVRAFIGAEGVWMQYFDDTTVYRETRSADEVSQTVRAAVSGGVRLSPTDTVELIAEAAIAAQHEAYQREEASPQGLFQQDASAVTLAARGRLLAAYRVWPNRLRLCGTVRGERFTLTRSQSDLAFLVGSVLATSDRLSGTTRAEIAGRVDGDVEAISVFGLLPGFFVQLERIAFTGDGASLIRDVPSAGIGIRSSRLDAP